MAAAARSRPAETTTPDGAEQGGETSLTRTALYTGSFDPLTNGHLEVIRASFSLCDRLVVAIGVHATKTPLLSVEDRVALIETEARPRASAAGCALEVRRFDGLAVEAAREAGAGFMIRGLRSGADFEDEIVMAGMNRAMAPDIQTVFLPASPETRHITGTLVRQIAAMGGDVSPFVPKGVAAMLSVRHRRS